MAPPQQPVDDPDECEEMTTLEIMTGKGTYFPGARRRHARQSATGEHQSTIGCSTRHRGTQLQRNAAPLNHAAMQPPDRPNVRPSVRCLRSMLP